MTIRPEPGKRYVTRGGDVTGPMVFDPVDGVSRAPVKGNLIGWLSNGRHERRCENPLDLISEYTEPSAEGATVTREWLEQEIEYEAKCGGVVNAQRHKAYLLALEHLDQIEPPKPKTPTEAVRIAGIIREECGAVLREFTLPAAHRILREVVESMIATAFRHGWESATNLSPTGDDNNDYAARIIAAAIGDER